MQFDLPDDDNDFELAKNGSKLHGVLWEFDQRLRSIVKHGSSDFQDADIDTVDKIRNILHEVMEEFGISFDNFL